MYSRTMDRREHWIEVSLLANRSNPRQTRINVEMLVRCSDEMTSFSVGTVFISL